MSHLAIESLKIQLNEVVDFLKNKNLNPKVAQIIATGAEFAKQHEESLTIIR